MPRIVQPVPDLAQRALSMWMVAHLEELRALLSPWDLAPERLSTPTFTYTVDRPDTDPVAPASPPPAPKRPTRQRATPKGGTGSTTAAAARTELGLAKS